MVVVVVLLKSLFFSKRARERETNTHRHRYRHRLEIYLCVVLLLSWLIF